MKPFFLRRSQLSLQNKVFLTFVALLLFILGCFIVYVNLVVIKPLKEKTVEAKLAAATKVSQQLDDYVDSQNQLSQRILSSKDLFSILERGYQTDVNLERLNQSRRLKDLMFQAIGPRMSIKDMVIYDKAGRKIVSYIELQGDAASFESYLKKSLIDGSWSGSGYILERQGEAVSFIRSINNQNGTVFGYLSILLDNAFLQRISQGVGSGQVYILDRNGEPVVGSIPDEELAELTARNPVDGVYVDDHGNYVAYARSESTGWTTYLVTPKQDVLGPVNSVKYLSILLITSLMLLSFVYIYFSTRNLLLPIRKLRSQIWRISYSNMNLKWDNPTQNNDL
ncbi:cache domain-containing protein, partial [Paenibacillus sp. p3-SID1389]